MFRLVGKLQWKHPAPAKWDEGRNYICEKEIALNIKHSNRNWIFRTVTLANSYLGIFADNKKYQGTRNLGARWAPISSWWPSATLLALRACFVAQLQGGG